MTSDATSSSQDRTHTGATVAHLHDSPFLRAPEGAKTVFLTTVLAVCGPLLGGVVMFGWRASMTAALAIASCVITERLYYRVTRIPALLGRSHSVLTGVLLALTLPAFVPWFVPVVAGAFAIIVGKAVFGGVGHFVWQPALVGRLAVAVLFPALLTVADARFEGRQPVLAQNRLLVGDIREAAYGNDTAPWRGRAAPHRKDAVLLTPPTRILRGLTDRKAPAYSSLVRRPADQPDAKPAGLLQMPPMENLFYGARPGGLGETCILLLIVACLGHRGDQAPAASGDYQIDQPVGSAKGRDYGMVEFVDDRHASLRQGRVSQTHAEDLGDGEVGVEGLLSSAKDASVAAFEAQARGVAGDVGAALEDDRHHADGHTTLLDPQPVGAIVRRVGLADGIGLAGDITQGTRHRVNTVVVERQTLDHSRGQAELLAASEVLLVGLL